MLTRASLAHEGIERERERGRQNRQTEAEREKREREREAGPVPRANHPFRI